MENELLEIFEQNRGKPIFDGDIASRLGVTRSEIGAAVSVLQKRGYAFDSVGRQGYIFSKKNDVISAVGIQKYIKESRKNIICLDRVDSTNIFLKQQAAHGAAEGTVAVTEMQTAGRGRRGKQFFSPKGCGIYFSLLLRPRLKADESVFITVAAAVAVRRALKQLLNIDTQIKWVNDIYFNDKKLCGILTESSIETESGCFRYAVLGIGINIKQPKDGYPEAFAFKTTHLSEIAAALPDDFKNKCIAEVIVQFDKLYEHLEQKEYVKEYKEASCMLGRKIEILSGPYAGSAVAEDIDENANLIVRLPNKSRIALNSGDVSICL